MNINEISFERLKFQIETFLRQEYNKANILFSQASPYGQILSVVENLFQLSMLYLKNSLKQYDLSEANAKNPRIIRNAAIFAGHVPSRAVSATGTIALVPKPSAALNEIGLGRITLTNRQTIKNKTNGLEYSLSIGGERVSYSVNAGTPIYLSITQGKWEQKSFTGNGNPNQSFQVSIRGGNKDVENFNYEVLVNGEPWEVKKHIYDMLPDEKACVVRTGFDNGIDVFFGNGGFGAVPGIGAPITVGYLVTDGATGNIYRRTQNDWTFIVPIVDGLGNTVEVGTYFDTYIVNDINFGAPAESTEFTKSLLPISSNNFVLALPQQYAYHIKRLGVFSHVNAYEKLGTVYIVATPNIKLFKNKNADYFSVDMRAFELDQYEKTKLDKYLKTGGNIMLTRRYKIESPTISKFIANIFVITYSDSTDESVQSQILDKISDYFLNMTRLDRIPKSDIINLLSDIPDIHSVDVSFVAKKDEDYHAQQLALQETTGNVPLNYDPAYTEAIDPVLGDILFLPNELPVIRGGWNDRNGTYYSDNISDSGLKSVNIFKRGSVSPEQRTRI